MDMIAHLTRQAAFSKATFGPGPRTHGVIEHIKKELGEVEAVYLSNDGSPAEPADASVHRSAAGEWTDVAILGLDGLLRALSAAMPSASFDQVAGEAVAMIVAKQGKNERREWPDWRTMSDGQAIEHVRGIED